VKKVDVRSWKFEVLSFVLLWLPLTLLAQQRDTNRPPTATVPAGAGEISGVVQSPEGQPIGRAVVTLSGDVPAPKSVMSDDAGAFRFASVPGGSFSITARKAAYLAAPYGATRPGRTGTPISLAPGQRANIRLTMFKGAALTGTLRDSAGSPLAGIDVRIIDVRTLAALENAPPEVTTTDDRGVFRIYNVLPGEYVVVALPGSAGAEIGAPSAMEMDTTLAALSARERSSNVASPTSQPIQVPLSRPISFAPVFYPGTPNYENATRVRVAGGEERSGIDFELKPVPVSAIDASVSGFTDIANVQVTLIPTGPRFATTFSSSSLAGKPLDAQGVFRYSNLAPGRYRLVARARRGDAAPPVQTTTTSGAGGGGRGGGAPVAGGPQQPATGDYLFAYADIELRGDDVAGISLALQPGAAISGRVVMSGGSSGVKPADVTKIRPYVAPEGGGWTVSSGGIAMGPSIIGQPIVIINADGTFELRGIGPGKFTFGVNLPADAKGWSLRSVKSGTRDLLDEQFELLPGMAIRDVTITFSDSPSDLSGTLQSASGQPTTDYYIVLFPEDRALWRVSSRRIMSARPSTSGRFMFANVPSGSYVVAALSDLDPLDLLDLTFLEQIAPAGVKVSIGEAEKKVQDLRIK
jgi:hypothetical protein